MVKTISKKCLSILMILVLLFSAFTVPVHAEVLTVSTAVGVAVVAASLCAIGVYCANSDARNAINAAAMDFINHEASYLQSIKVVATATGKVFAIWGSTLWNKFTQWIQNTFGADGMSNISLGSYAIPTVTMPNATPFSLAGWSHVGATQSVFHIPGTGVYIENNRLMFSNGYISNFIGYNNFNYRNIYLYGSSWTAQGQFFFGVPGAYSASQGYFETTADRASRWLITSGNIGNNVYIYNTYGSLTFSDGSVYFNNHLVSTGYNDLLDYKFSCIAQGVWIGNFTHISGGMNVPRDPNMSSRVRASYGSNSPFSGLASATNPGGTLPITASPGQDIMVPVWGTWVNGDGIPIGWAGPQGTYGTPSGTITPGTTIAGTGTGTANPPVTYPGDDVINPTLGRDGVAPFPTLGDDVINPADDTFITDIDDYIDPTIDQLTTPTDVSTLTQNPTDVVGPTTDVFPESDDIPNSIRDTATDTIPDVDSPAIPDVDTATDTATPINPDASDDTSTDERNTNRLKLSTLILSKFPFCIPWDIYRTVATMVQEPEIPSFDWRFSLPTFNIDETIHIDFEQFETVAYIVRWFLSACWLVTLVLLTRKVIWK